MIQTEDPAHHAMGDTLDHDGLDALSLFLRTNRGRPVAIDGTEVGRVGALATQILIIGSKTWATENLAYVIHDPSGKVAESFATLGLSQQWAEISQPEGVRT